MQRLFTKTASLGSNSLTRNFPIPSRLPTEPSPNPPNGYDHDPHPEFAPQARYQFHISTFEFSILL